MYNLHCTNKLLDRIKPTIAASALSPTTVLGNWYATALFWKPQVALLVNERTLLPVLMLLAPASSLSTRFPDELAVVLEAHGVDRAAIGRETAAMIDVAFAKTASRSVLGSMNDFAFLTAVDRERFGNADLTSLSLRLADTPCSPIKYNSPARLIGQVFSDALRCSSSA